MIRVVLDTNVLVSALLFGGNPGQIYILARQRKIIVALSRELAHELEDVLVRPKFVQILARRSQTVEALLTDYFAYVEYVEPADNIPMDAVRDPKDRMVLATAVGGKADYIVSGDSDLIALSHYQNIPIVSAADFLEKASL